MDLTINGEKIDEFVIEEEFDAIKEHHEALGEVVCCDRDDEFRERALENVIHRTLLRQESTRCLGPVSDEDVTRALADLKQEHGGEEDFFKNTGYSPDQEDKIRARISESLSVNRVLEDHVGPDPEPSDGELNQFYEDHLDDYRTAEEVRAWHIYLEPHSQEEANAVFAQLRETRRQLLDGADFEEKAKELCREDHQMDLGFYSQGNMMREVEIQTFSMEVGEISPVFPTHFGYHLFKLVDRKPAEPIPFEEVKDNIAERYPIEYRESRVQKLVDELKSKADIQLPDIEAPAIA